MKKIRARMIKIGLRMRISVDVNCDGTPSILKGFILYFVGYIFKHIDFVFALLL